MKTFLAMFGWWVAVVASAATRTEIEIEPVFGEEPLRIDDSGAVSSRGQSVSVSRLDFLISGFALQRADGTWEEAEDGTAFLSLGQERTKFTTRAFGGRYKAVRFLVGVKPETNKADAARWPANHPLNPVVNGLHWGWSGGYVFLALEGRWIGDDNRLHGYSFHVARDENLRWVKIPFKATRVGSMQLKFDVGRVFNAVRLSRFEASTHSRSGDPLARVVRNQVAKAFSVAGIQTQGSEETVAERERPLVAPNATAYRFTYPAYFPAPALPLDNPLTEEGVALGKRLFHEVQLSGNRAQSCASCHRAEHGFAEPLRTSTGAMGTVGKRNSMPLMNLAWKSSYFWDGRAPSLRAQVLMPIQDEGEMNAKLPEVVERLSATEEYPRMFEAAFGMRTIDADRIARALEQFALTLVAGNSKFDAVMRGEEKFTEEEQRGFELFHTEYDPRREQYGADCFHCHGGPLFQSVDFANNGIMRRPEEIGREGVTKRHGDEGKFAVPSLRNVAQTGPYMHDGHFGSLEEVVRFYNLGVRSMRTLDPNLAKHLPAGLRLRREDEDALVAFLETLSER